MAKGLVRISKRVYRRSTEFAIAKPNVAAAALIGVSIVAAVILWSLIIPIFSPQTIAPYMHAGLALPW